MYQIVRYGSREEWEAGRSEGIGASEIGAVLGISKWQTPYQLWRRKKGIDTEEDDEAKRSKYLRGHLLEDGVAKWFAQKENVSIDEDTAEDFSVVSVEKPFLRVSPDRFFEKDGESCVLECKTTALKVDSDDIPLYWYAQLQMNLGVCEKKRGALAWLGQGLEFGCVWYDFDPDFFAVIQKRAEEFWTRYIVGDEEPPMTRAEDVSIKYQAAIADKTIEASAAEYEALSNLRFLKEKKKQTEAEIKEQEDKIKAFMGESDTLVDYEGVTLATWKNSKGRESVDAKALKEAHPIIFKKFVKIGKPSRTFLIK